MDVTLDFETRSRIDLPECGLYRYAEDSSTEALCLCWMVDDGPYVESWTLFDPPPTSLFRLMQNPDFLLHAWNAQFEIEILKMLNRTKGWPEPPPLRRWRDTMAEAAVAGYPQKLELTSRLVGGQQKKETGKGLIKMFSIPDNNGDFSPVNSPAYDRHFRELVSYCRQDVRAERAIHNEVSWKMTEKEQKVWEHVVLMNQRGLPVDEEAIDAIIIQLEKDAEFNTEYIKRLTNGAITAPTQTKRILEYIRALGVDIPNMTADTVEAYLDDETIPYKARLMLSFRASAGKSSTAKFRTLKNQLCSDGTVKGNLRYYGALTGRHSGLGFQPQNLPQYHHDNPDEVLEIFKTADYSTLRIMYAVEKAASGLIRHSVKAPKGTRLLVNDLSSVEAVGTAWLTGEWEIIEDFKKGRDIYKSQAVKMYSVRYEDVSGQQRQAGKIAVLACGYAGGYIVYIRMAAKYRVKFTEAEAKSIVSLFRRSRPKLTRAWKSFENAMIQAVLNPGLIVPVEDIKCAFQALGDTLRMMLPSGRYIYYPNVKPKQEYDRFGNLVTIVYAYTNDEAIWAMRPLSGPLMFQNAVQGLCRDLLVEGQLRLEEFGYPQIGSVHDEALSLMPDGQGSPEEMGDIMCMLPEWADGFPLRSKGYASVNYKKD